MRFTRRTMLAASASTLPLALAGCLGSGNDEEADGTADDDGEPEEANGDGDGDGDETVRVEEHDEYGEILVDAEGMTLYQFDQDEQGAEESACYDDCEEAWPPLTVEGEEEEEEPTAGDDVEAELTTFEREGGERQVAADGWPLYYFAQDEEPGDAEGQGINDVWWVVRPDGTPLRPAEQDGEGDDENGAEEDDGDVGGY